MIDLKKNSPVAFHGRGILLCFYLVQVCDKAGGKLCFCEVPQRGGWSGHKGLEVVLHSSVLGMGGPL